MVSKRYRCRCNAVVCLKGWDTVVQTYASRFMIDKLYWLFPCRETGYQFKRNGINGLRDSECSGFMEGASDSGSFGYNVVA